MMSQVATARSLADNLRKQVQEVRPKTNSALTTALDAFDHSLLEVRGTPPRFFGEDTGDRTSLQYLARQLRVVDSSVDGSDAPLTAGDRAACAQVKLGFSSAMLRWTDLKTTALAQINSQLQQAGLHPLRLSN
jgi:dipeptidyl aminopeptidase/acylaminoacyl peptidase